MSQSLRRRGSYGDEGRFGSSDSLQVCGPRMGRIARRAVQWSSYLSDLKFQPCLFPFKLAEFSSKFATIA
jgi:hypothetical protein